MCDTKYTYIKDGRILMVLLKFLPAFAVKKIGHHERRIANDIIHKITREIVNRAIETDSLIILGKLKGLRIKRRRRKKEEGESLTEKFPDFHISSSI